MSRHVLRFLVYIEEISERNLAICLIMDFYGHGECGLGLTTPDAIDLGLRQTNLFTEGRVRQAVIFDVLS